MGTIDDKMHRNLWEWKTVHCALAVDTNPIRTCSSNLFSSGTCNEILTVSRIKMKTETVPSKSLFEGHPIGDTLECVRNEKFSSISDCCGFLLMELSRNRSSPQIRQSQSINQ